MEIDDDYQPLEYIGACAYRMLIPFDKIMANENTRKIFENEIPGFAPALHPETGVGYVSYPCRG